MLHKFHQVAAERLIKMIYAFFPLLMEGIGASRYSLIGTGVEHPHEDIAVYNRLHGLCEQRQGDGKAGVGFMPLALTDYGDLGISAFSSPADVPIAEARQPPPVWLMRTAVRFKSYFPDKDMSMIWPITIREG